ncbi:MAG TPA: tyrosine-type recombinase/integrase [Pyrinomonadaceae bacterium]|nr:tyrosine-type recombinase/integrase [Pyrinomonadaceae bacterium]
MATYKRWHGRKITTDHPQWKRARWTIEFMLRGRRIVQSVPEARTQAQAERAESQLREDIYNRRYGQGKTMGLSDFFDNNYLSWLKENRSASAYRDALSRGKELKRFFRNQPVREISTTDCERFKSMLGKAETARNELRSGSTVNRYMALLSGVCRRAIKEELMSANPCSQIDEEPENSRARYLTVEEQNKLFAVLKDDLAFLNAPITVTLGTGMRKGIELLKLKVGHLNFSSLPVFFPVRGGSAELPPNWLIVVEGKGNRYRLIPMNSQVRDTLFHLCRDRTSDEFVFDKDVNEVNEYALRWGFEAACTRAEIVFGETVPGGIIWHDLRRTFATRLRANGVHEYDISDLLGHSRPGVTNVYARATRTVLEQAVEKLTEPWGQVIEFDRKAG